MARIRSKNVEHNEQEPKPAENELIDGDRKDRKNNLV